MNKIPVYLVHAPVSCIWRCFKITLVNAKVWFLQLADMSALLDPRTCVMLFPARISARLTFSETTTWTVTRSFHSGPSWEWFKAIGWTRLFWYYRIFDTKKLILRNDEEGNNTHASSWFAAKRITPRILQPFGTLHVEPSYAFCMRTCCIHSAHDILLSVDSAHWELHHSKRDRASKTSCVSFML